MSPSDLRPAPSPAVDAADARRLAWARSLVEHLSREELISFLHQYAPGVERLGIGQFVTGTEGLHGVAWKGPATQFPQPVGMAATWDPGLLQAAGRVVGTEVRELREEHGSSVSLTVWAPVVNPLRHPLWGRSEEAFTEDPLLNAEVACGFAAGLSGRGDTAQPDTWTTLPTLKHFLAYSNETDRAATSSDLSPRVLHEYELPGYVEPLVRGVAGSVMLAYNLVNGRPAHLTDLLASELRSRLPDPDLLFVVSDAGAPANLFRSQKVTPDATTAYAAMLRAGVDSFTDNDTDPTETITAVTAALDTGLIDLDHVRRAVVRQLVARARTGEFDALLAAADGSDGDSSVSAVFPASRATPAAPTRPSRAERRSLSREVATRAAVLLHHHDRRTGASVGAGSSPGTPDDQRSAASRQPLPLRAGTLAVVGDLAHTVLRDWYSGDLIDPRSLVDALRERIEAGSLARTTLRTATGLDRVSLAVVGSGALPGAPSITSGPDPVLFSADSSLRCVRIAAAPAAPLAPSAAAAAPAAPAPAENPGDQPSAADGDAAVFELVDLGEQVIALRDVNTGLLVSPDDRGQLTASAERIGGWVVQETFLRHLAVDGTWQLQHTGSGRFVGVESYTGALVLRSALPRSGARFAVTDIARAEWEFAEATAGADAVVLVVGDDPHVHGRETEDRPHLRLPEPARAAVEQLATLPSEVTTILVITSSYPYDLDGLEDRVDAVVWSSHAGEAEGEALADLLTGRRDFSGRLAQTWPGSAQLPSVLDYDVISTSSTYLYGQEARFAFGHGLALDPVQWQQAEVTAGADALHIEVALAAPASRRTAGPLHETVQVYADVPEQSFSRRHYTVPHTRLVGFATTEVPENGSVTARISVPYGQLALYAPDREGWELPDGPVTIRVSRSSIDPVFTHEVTIPAGVLAAAPLPPAPTGRIPADRAEETSGLARSAITLLEGTELRPTGSAAGWADLVLDAGTVVIGLETRPLGSPGTSTARAELIDPAADAASAAALPLPHTVPAEQGRPTGRVRVRLVGPLALTGLQTQQR